jgi:hypothetical protein
MEPLPEQLLGRKRPRLSWEASAHFCWMTLLAPVEIQLMLRCLDVRSRLIAARCNKQLYAAANHPFAWPQEPSVMLRVDNEATALQSFGARVRRSLLRLVPIRLSVQLRRDIQLKNAAFAFLHAEILAVPNVRALKLQLLSATWRPVAYDFLLPLLLHPDAEQLRSIDILRFQQYDFTPAMWQRLQSFPHLHSLSVCPVGGHPGPRFANYMQQLSLLPSLNHLSMKIPEYNQNGLYPSLSRGAHLVSLHLEGAFVDTKLVNCLAQLPQLQRLQLRDSRADVHLASAWTALCSLREVQLEDVSQSDRLLPLLSSLPSLRLLRWRCRAPSFFSTDGVGHPSTLPLLAPLRRLLHPSPLLRVQLLLPHYLQQWTSDPRTMISAAQEAQRRCVWDELHQLPSQLPRTRIVEVNLNDDEWRSA